jgi:hypothetical protein
LANLAKWKEVNSYEAEGAAVTLSVAHPPVGAGHEAEVDLKFEAGGYVRLPVYSGARSPDDREADESSEVGDHRWLEVIAFGAAGQEEVKDLRVARDQLESAGYGERGGFGFGVAFAILELVESIAAIVTLGLCRQSKP